MKPEEETNLFVDSVRERAEKARYDLVLLNRKALVLEMKLARTEIYIKQLNDFIVREGGEPVPFSPIANRRER